MTTVCPPGCLQQDNSRCQKAQIVSRSLDLNPTEELHHGQICSNCLTLSNQHGPKCQRNASSSSSGDKMRSNYFCVPNKLFSITQATHFQGKRSPSMNISFFHVYNSKKMFCLCESLALKYHLNLVSTEDLYLFHMINIY